MTKRKPMPKYASGDFVTVAAPVGVAFQAPYPHDFDNRKGWLCPGCDTYYAPSVRSCDCLTRHYDE